MSKVLAVTEDERMRFVCHQYQTVPMALADHTHDTRVRWNNLLEEKAGHVNLNVSERDARIETLQRANLNAESLLKAGVLVKEVKQAAERQLLSANIEVVQEKRVRSIRDRM